MPVRLCLTDYSLMPVHMKQIPAWKIVLCDKSCVFAQDVCEKRKTLYMESFGPEWCISSMIYSGDIPFWSETLDMNKEELNSFVS